jgi:hypothetical protein
MSQAPFAARDSGPFYWPPWKSRNVVLLGKSLANQCLQRAPKKLLVALGPGARDVDQQVSPGHGGDKARVAGAGLNILLPLVVVALPFAKVLPVRLCLQNGMMLLIAPVWIDPGACGFTDQNPRLGLGLGGQERFGAWFDCCLKDQGGLGGKQRASIEASSCLPLTFCCLSCSVSCLSCSVSFSIRSLSFFTRKMSLSSCFIRCSC